ncbi:4Fe-4S binding protein [Solidesulfovibrio sp. C21]|uniref:4Fe-4S binding protein n=1 Tax=Solidesulfovibrio sp. C21 TaxID=3398613 RepID=UPI0039FCE534
MSDTPYIRETRPGVKPAGRGRGAGNAAALALQLTGLSIFAAHALRVGRPGLAMAAATFFLPVLVCRRDARYILGPALLAAGLVLARAGTDIVLFRLAAGEPWLRASGIMGLVVAVCLGGGLAAFSPGKAPDAAEPPEHAVPRGVAFWLTAGLLWLARAKAPFPVLLADRFFPGWGDLEIALLGLYAAWLTGRMVTASRTGPLRLRYWTAFSLVFFGQLALGLAGIGQCLMTGTLHPPVPALIVAGPIYRGGGYFMPILYLSTLLLVGPGWCAHLCYVGALDGLCAAASGKKPARLPVSTTRWRIASLALCIIAAAGLRALGVDTAVALALVAVFGLAGLAIMVVASRKTGVMVHCTSYCPIGFVGNVLGKISPWRLRIAPGCDGCGRCSRACRYLALPPQALAEGRPGGSCTLCGDCLGACPASRITLSFPGLSPVAARTAYLTLVVSLHAVFLGVARI